MERKLASIQTVAEIKEHPNADSLLIAKVLGWNVIINKAENFKVGDKIVYFEIDSFLPIREEFEFLRKSSYKNSPILGEGFRLKPVKLRGVISSGLILPLSAFFTEEEIANMPVGLDVSEKLNVKKWEEPEVAKLGGDAVGKRPNWIEKSNEERIQSSPGLLDEFGDSEFYISTKLDGSSHFIAVDENGDFHFGSHNLELKPVERQGSFYNFILKHDLIKKMSKLRVLLNAQKIYVIGELCGEGIQKNRLGLQKKIYWYPFTFVVDGKRVGLNKMTELVRYLDVEMVPVEEVGKNLKNSYPSVEALLERAKENRKHIYPGQCEGIVIRPVEPFYSEILGTDLSVKIINNEYLLKE